MKAYFEDHRASFDEHLEWLRQIEADGTMFAAGVLKDETGWDGSGMAIIRAASYDEAVKVGEAEPFHRAGVRKNTIQGWVMNEANFQFTLKVIGNEGDEEVGRCFNKRGRKFTPAVPAKGREMFRFKGIKTLKKFASAHASIQNHFNHDRYLNPPETFKKDRFATLAKWCWLTAQLLRCGRHSETSLHWTDSTRAAFTVTDMIAKR